ncbi:MAG: MltR family transcriptional regulator, partial [Peptostreptococcaceae bacterium]
MGNTDLILGILKQQENLKAINKEIDEGSDRAVGILCGSILEEQLKKILKTFLVKDIKVEKEFLGGKGAISTFESRIIACYSMGLIDDTEYKNLEIMRKIRNKFAHSFEPIDFNNQAVKDLCNNLKVPIEKYMPKIIKIKDNKACELDLEPFKPDCSRRDRFVKTFNYLSMLFTFREFEISNKRLKKLEDSETIAYKQKAMCDKLEESLVRVIELTNKYLKLLEKNKKLMQENEEKLGLIDNKLEVARKDYSEAIENYKEFKP